MLYYLLVTIYVVVCLVLMLVILLQQGKGGDIASAFGGGSSQAAFGARTGATVLSRATTVGFVLFIVGALALGIMGQRGPGSVLGGRRTARPPATTPAAPGKPSTPSTPAAPAQQSAPVEKQPAPAPAK
jgi:preprotein translocase subunit SecG